MTKIPNGSCFRIALLVAGLVPALTSCRDEGITTYRTPKEAVQEPQAVPTDAGAPAEVASLQWRVPDAWKVEPASGMRVASFSVTGSSGKLDISVSPLPGTRQDDLANVNRWRGQLKLAAISEAELPGALQTVKSQAGDVMLVDLGDSAGAGSRILGAWLHQPTQVWFFKMMGPSDMVSNQKGAFLQFIQSLTLGNAPVSGGTAAAAPATPPMPAGMASMPVQSDSGASLVWSAPSEWTAQKLSPTRKGSYSVEKGVEVAVTAFPGDVGGVTANINRWRGMVGLDAIDDAHVSQYTTDVENSGLHFTLVESIGSSDSIIVAMVPWNGGTWFFKLTGSTPGVLKAKPSFIGFIKTVHAP